MEANISQVVEIEYSQKVLRCTCKVRGLHPGEVCPNAKVVDLGVAAYYHRRPLKRLLGALRAFHNGVRNRKAREG